MKRLVTWSIVTIALLATVSHATAQAEGPVPEPLPFGPDTSRFEWFVTPDVGVVVSCGQNLQTSHGGPADARPFASNNPNDPCARAEPTSSENTRAAFPNFNPITIAIVPVLTAAAPMDTETAITGEFTLLFDPINDAIPADFGAVKPKVSLIVGETTVASWDGAGEVLDEFEAPTTEDVAVTFTFDLGKAPEELPKGAPKIVIDMSNDAEAGELRAITQRANLAQTDAGRGHVILPFKEGANPPPTQDEGNESDNETGNETDGGGNETVGNETTNTTAPTPTNTTATNNTSAPPTTDESGFLPGFEVVAVVSAALIALAYVSRERRRPPMRPIR